METIDITELDPSNFNWLREGKKSKETELQKGRVYLEPGQQAPEGVQVQTGPRGGQFYDESPNVTSGNAPIEITSPQVGEGTAPTAGVEAFSDELEAFPYNPMLEAMQISTASGEAVVKLKPDPWNEGGYYLDEIRTLEDLGGGAGSAALKEVTDLADKHNVTLRLNATPLRSGLGRKSTPEQLQRFYEKAGFTFNRPAKKLPEGVAELANIQTSVINHGHAIMDEHGFDLTIKEAINYLPPEEAQIVAAALESDYDYEYNSKLPIDDFENVVESRVNEAFTAAGGAQGTRFPKQDPSEPITINVGRGWTSVPRNQEDEEDASWDDSGTSFSFR